MKQTARARDGRPNSRGRGPLRLAAAAAALFSAHAAVAPGAVAGSSEIIFLSGTVPPTTGLSLGESAWQGRFASSDRNVLDLTIETNYAGGVEVQLTYAVVPGLGGLGAPAGADIFEQGALGLVAPAAGPLFGAARASVPYGVYSGGNRLDFSSGEVTLTNRRGNRAALDLQIVYLPAPPAGDRGTRPDTAREVAAGDGHARSLGRIVPAAGRGGRANNGTLTLTLRAA